MIALKSALEACLCGHRVVSQRQPNSLQEVRVFAGRTLVDAALE
jgi:hypothetical protein